jgi:hypothetical protein
VHEEVHQRTEQQDRPRQPRECVRWVGNGQVRHPPRYSRQDDQAFPGPRWCLWNSGSRNLVCHDALTGAICGFHCCSFKAPEGVDLGLCPVVSGQYDEVNAIGDQGPQGRRRWTALRIQTASLRQTEVADSYWCVKRSIL